MTLINSIEIVIGIGIGTSNGSIVISLLILSILVTLPLVSLKGPLIISTTSPILTSIFVSLGFKNFSNYSIFIGVVIKPLIFTTFFIASLTSLKSPSIKT